LHNKDTFEKINPKHYNKNESILLQVFVITPFFVTLAVVPPFWNHLGTKHPPTPPFGDEINSTPQTFNMSLLFALQRETYPFPRPQFEENQQPVNQGQRAFG